MKTGNLNNRFWLDAEAGELDREIAAQDIVQAPAATDGDLWVIGIADHHGAPVLSNDSFDEYRASYPWLSERPAAREPCCAARGD